MSDSGAILDLHHDVGDLQPVVHAQWPRGIWTAKPMDGGMTNRNWRVDLKEPAGGASKAYAVQLLLPGVDAERLGISRSTQAEVMTIVDALALGPKLIAWHDGEPTAIVTEFIETHSVTTEADRMRVARLTGQALSTLHSQTADTPLSGIVSDAFDGVEWLYEKAQRVAPEAAAQYAWALDVNRRCAEARGTYTRCLVHSDLSVGNVLAREDGVALIDWEYAGDGDRYFDCADFVEKWNLTLDEEQAFLDQYQPDANPEFLAAVVYMYRFSSRLREGIWAAAASAAQFIDFDHLAYAKTCLTRLNTIMESDRFEKSIEVVSRNVVG